MKNQFKKKQLFSFSSQLKWFKCRFKNNKILMVFWLTRFKWNFILNYFNKILFNWLNEKTPLQEAVENENIEIISLLLKHKDINTNVENEIFFFKNNYEVCFYLLMISH